MLKPKQNFFNKTISKQKINLHTQEIDPKKTRRSYFKLTQNNTNLNTIIKDLQRNVKQLKIFHQSLQKIPNFAKNQTEPIPINKLIRLKKSQSLNEINKLQCNNVKSKTKTKRSLNRQYNKINFQHNQNQCKKAQQQNNNLKNYPHHPHNLQNKKTIHPQVTLQKYNQNASTMLSIHNADVDEVKRAYQNIYGKENTNIIDLYNFFRKNIEKSTRIHGSMEISNFPQHDHSQQLFKSRQTNNQHRKSNQLLLNVIIQDKPSKQIAVDPSNDFQNQCSSIYRLSVKKHPTMEEIFKNGSPDLANVFDFVKKRRVSLKNYIRSDKNKQNIPINANLNIQEIMKQQQKSEWKNHKDLQKQGQVKDLKNVEQNQDNQNGSIQCSRTVKNLQYLNNSSPLIKQSSLQKENQSQNKLPFLKIQQQSQLSNQKYYPSKSSKSSNKKSIKKSKHKQIDLDQNIEDYYQINDFQHQINNNEQFNPSQINSNQQNRKQKALNQKKLFDINNGQQLLSHSKNSKNQINRKQLKKTDQKDQKRVALNRDFDEALQNSSEGIHKNQIFKKSKYYVEPIPFKKQSSLDGCSISVKSSPRIIELDFIQLDL